VHLPQSLRGATALKALIDDDDTSVRIAAYESVSRTGDPELVQSTEIGGKGEFKFVLDLVPSKKPLIYITHGAVPRLVIFDSMLGFRTPAVAKLWNNRMMIRSNAQGQLVSVFFQPPGEADAKTVSIAPTLANLVLLMGNQPNNDSPMEGLDLTYSQVVNAVYTLAKQGDVPSPIEIRSNALVEAVAKARETPEEAGRPEFGADEDGGTGDAAEGSADAKAGEAAPSKSADQKKKSGEKSGGGSAKSPGKAKESTASRPEFSTPEEENGAQPVVR